MIKAVIFDIGGVLVTDLFPPIMRAIRKKSKNDREEIYSARDPYWKELKLGRITEDEFWAGFLEKAGLQAELPQMKEEMKTLARSSMRILDDTVEIVKLLKKNKDIKLTILSNNAVEWADYSLNACGLGKYFEEIILSCDVNLAKPDKKIYSLTIKRLAIKPDECVFIDNQERNLDEPANIGMKTILFKDAKMLGKALKELGIVF